MQTFLVFAVTLAVAGATVLQFSPTLYSAAIPITTQYHAQDGLGQYSYGYSGGPSAKAEYKSLDGVTRGSYSYVDADGELQTVEYTADSANGFQASATNLPKAPIDDKTAPKPVEDTPEVAMAKVEHFAAYREAELRAAEQPSNGEENGNEGQDEQQSNGSQERTGGISREPTSAETESPNGVDTSNERSEEIGGSTHQSTNGNGNENGNANGNGNGHGNGNGNGNGGNGGGGSLINTLNADLSLNGLLSSGLISNGLTLGSLNGNTQLTSSTLNALSNLQLNEELRRNLDANNAAMRYSDITPATTSQLHPVSLQAAVQLPPTSYLRVSTPTHGYSIVSPTVLTAVPTLRATSSQTISRTLPISLSSAFLTQGLH